MGTNDKKTIKCVLNRIATTKTISSQKIIVDKMKIQVATLVGTVYSAKQANQICITNTKYPDGHKIAM